MSRDEIKNFEPALDNLIETYKILNGFTGTSMNNYFALNTNFRIRGHSLKLKTNVTDLVFIVVLVIVILGILT